MLKIRRSCDRLIFNMGIPIPGKDGLYIETGPDGISLHAGTSCKEHISQTVYGLVIELLFFANFGF